MRPPFCFASLIGMEVAGSSELLAYRLVGRVLTPDSTLIQLRGRRIGDGFFGLIAGPCSVETSEQMLETARAVKEGARHCCGAARSSRAPRRTRSRAWPTRARDARRGARRDRARHRDRGHRPRDVEEVAEVADVLQIGARNMQNFACSPRSAGRSRSC